MRPLDPPAGLCGIELTGSLASHWSKLMAQGIIRSTQATSFNGVGDLCRYDQGGPKKAQPQEQWALLQWTWSSRVESVPA